MSDISLLVVIIICLVCERLGSYSLKVGNLNLSRKKSLLLFFLSLCYLDEVMMLFMYSEFQHYFTIGLGAACYLTNLIFIPISSSLISWINSRQMYIQPEVLMSLIPILSISILVHIIIYLISYNQDNAVQAKSQQTIILMKNLLISWFLTTSYLLCLMVSQVIPYFSYYYFPYLGVFFLAVLLRFRRQLLFSNTVLFLKASEIFILAVEIFYHISIDLRVMYNSYNFQYVYKYGCSYMNWVLVFFFSQTIFILITFLITLNFYPDTIPNPYQIIYLCIMSVSIFIHARRVYRFVIAPMIFGEKLLIVNSAEDLIKYNKKENTDKTQSLEIIVINITENLEQVYPEFLHCVLFEFGNSQIKINNSQLTRLQETEEDNCYSQTVVLQNDIDETTFNLLLQKNKILPQIREIQYMSSGENQHEHYLRLLKISIQNDQIIKMVTQTDDSETSKLITETHFAFIQQVQQLIIIHRLSFQKLIQSYLNVNPNMAYYDLYDI